MKLAIGIALVVVGIILTVWGVSSADSFASEVSEFFTGNPSDEAMWLLVGGVGAIIGGGTLLLLSTRRTAGA